MKKLLVLLSLFMLAGCSKTEEPKQTDLNAPQNLLVEDNVVTFDSVDGTDVTYNLFIEDITKDKVMFKEIKDITETTYTLPTLDSNKLYEVRVQAENSEGTSVKTNAFNIHTFTELDTVYATYNTVEDTPVTILGIDVTEVYYITYGKIMSSKLSQNSFAYEENVLSLEYSNLNTDSTLTFYVFTVDGYYIVEVNKVTLESASIYSNNSVTFASEDLYFQFNLAGGEFVEISGSDIGTDDYTLINNTLVLTEEFISSLFTANPDRDIVILSYQLKTDDNIIIGYLFINKDTN